MSAVTAVDYPRLLGIVRRQPAPFTADDVATLAHLSRGRAASALDTLVLRGVLAKMPRAHSRAATSYVVVAGAPE